MIIARRLIQVTARNQTRKTKIRKRQMLRFHVERICLSCHGDALWADTTGGNRLCWLVLLVHICMCPFAAHTNTHADQCTVRCLWWMVAYWTSTSATKEHYHPQTDSLSTSRGLYLRSERGAYTTYWGAFAFLAPESKIVKHLIHPYWWPDELAETVGRFL